MTNTMNLPANYTALDEEELCYTTGGGVVETVAGGVIAVGVSALLAFIAGKAVGGIGSFFGDSLIGNVLSTGSSIMTAPVEAVAGLVGNVLSAVL